MQNYWTTITALLLTWFLKETISHNTHSLLLLVSLDGFRWDYLDKVKDAGRETPNFDRLIKNGVQAKSMKNIYVTKTLPNHFSIVTGMYAENHGVVLNSFYDPTYQEIFNQQENPEQAKQSKWWNNGTTSRGGEPIWITNEKIDKGSEVAFAKHSGVIMWFGCEAEIHGTTPFFCMPTNASIPFETRINKIVELFSTEYQPINLGLLWINEPDGTGHQFGPDSPEIIDKIVELDGVVGDLIKKLEEHHLFKRMNLIITSDHGMAEVGEDSVIALDDHVDASLYDQYGGGPIRLIQPKEDQLEEVYAKLKGIEHLTVYKKEEIPKEYHYTNNHRILPILIEADEGFVVVQNRSGAKIDKGTHGYNNNLASMHPFFVAHGPAFKSGYVSPEFNNVDLYPLMCEILDIDPAPHDGDFNNIKHILEDEEEEEEFHFELSITMITYLLVLVFSGFISGVFCIAACRIYRIHVRRRGMLISSVPLNNIDEQTTTHLLAGSGDEEEEIP